MKEYMKPEAEIVDFATEAITDDITGTVSGEGIKPLTVDEIEE